jgi:uncharacterized membrane protein YkvA (DUF1232 family)
MERPYNGDRPVELDGIDLPDSEEVYQKQEAYVRENLEDKMRSFRRGVRFTKHIFALFRYMVDENIPWYKKTIVVAALAYFIMPVDAVPDLIPIIGYMDDFGVIAAVLGFLGREIQPYYSASPAMGSQDEDSRR